MGAQWERTQRAQPRLTGCLVERPSEPLCAIHHDGSQAAQVCILIDRHAESRNDVATRAGDRGRDGHLVVAQLASFGRVAALAHGVELGPEAVSVELRASCTGGEPLAEHAVAPRHPPGEQIIPVAVQ